MPTYTTTYSLGKPVVGADEDAWGDTLNTSLDAIDDILDGTTPVTGIDINSGTLDGVTIGGTTAGAGTFTTLTANTSITGTLATAAQTNITSVGTLTSLGVSGDLTVDTNTLYVDSTNNRVGIGTSSPSVNAEIRGSSSNGQIRLGGSTTGTYGQFYSDNDGVLVLGADAGNNAASSSFRVEVDGTERMRIDSSGNVGIGTSSPSSYDGEAENLVVASSVHTGITIASTGSNQRTNLYFSDGTSGTAAYIGGFTYDHSNDNLLTRTGGAERMRIDSSGNVGIGTSSPNSPLEVSNGTENHRVAFGTGEVYLMARNASSYITQEYIANQHVFTGYGDNSSNEAMRINSSGELMVGTTNGAPVSNNVVGISARGQYGELQVSTEGSTGAPLYLNRKTSDGDIAVFRKDGSTVGSIGNSGNDFYVTGSVSNIAGVTFANSKMMPMKSGSLADGQSDLGSSSYRWRDAYLSGGVYLGGTGAANHLDDYEVGDVDISNLTFTNSGGAVANSNYDTLRYVKIGDQVSLTGNLYFDSVTSQNGNLKIPLPFANGGNDQKHRTISLVGNYQNSTVTVLKIEPNASYGELVFQNGWGNVSVSALQTYVFNITYFTN